MTPLVMKPNKHERNEWRRVARAAHVNGFHAVGDYYSALVDQPEVALAKFDAAQDGYRAWLVYGWPGFRTTELGRSFAELQDAYAA